MSMYPVSIYRSCVYLDEEQDLAVEIHECPVCHGLFGVDWTYLDQSPEEDWVMCPMCKSPLFPADENADDGLHIHYEKSPAAPDEDPDEWPEITYGKSVIEYIKRLQQDKERS